MPLKELSGIFPSLNATQNTITSPIDPNYNCVAWAVEDKLRWWEPFGLIIPASFPPYHWPDNLPHDLLPQTFVSFFEVHGYEVTHDPKLENDVEKLAIYVRENEFQHVARQLPSGRWTSKIGPQEDIEHDLGDLESDIPYGYGKASIFMKKNK
jgi:hypothetical protein